MKAKKYFSLFTSIGILFTSFSQNTTDEYVQIPGFKISSLDDIRGWSWNGETASYLAKSSNGTTLYIRPCDGKSLDKPISTQLLISSRDDIRGWSWDGKTASYLAESSNGTTLYIRSFDGKTLGDDYRSILFGKKGDMRGWSWDGETASYLAESNGKTILYIRGFDGYKFDKNYEEIIIGRSGDTRGWNWSKGKASYCMYIYPQRTTSLIFRQFDGKKFGMVTKYSSIKNRNYKKPEPKDPMLKWAKLRNCRGSYGVDGCYLKNKHKTKAIIVTVSEISLFFGNEIASKEYTLDPEQQFFIKGHCSMCGLNIKKVVFE